LQHIIFPYIFDDILCNSSVQGRIEIRDDGTDQKGKVIVEVIKTAANIEELKEIFLHQSILDSKVGPVLVLQVVSYRLHF